MRPFQLLLFFSFFSITSLCFSQKKDSLHFKVEYFPDKNYSYESNTDLLTELRYFITDKKVLEEMKKQYPENPIIEKTKGHDKITIKTGNLSKDSLFSVSMKIEESDTPSSIGLILTGSCESGKMPVFTSVTAPGLDKKQQQSIIQTYQDFITGIKYPNKKLKIGDAFSTSNPINLPLSTDTNVEMIIITNYVLKDIKKNTAYLDFTQNYIIKNKEGGIKFTGRGNGKGKMIYDSNLNFITSSKTNANIEMEMYFQGVKFIGKLKVISEEIITIE